MTILSNITAAILERQEREQQAKAEYDRLVQEELERFKVSGIPETIEAQILDCIEKYAHLPSAVTITVEVGDFSDIALSLWLKSVGLTGTWYSCSDWAGFLRLQVHIPRVGDDSSRVGDDSFDLTCGGN